MTDEIDIQIKRLRELYGNKPVAVELACVCCDQLSIGRYGDTGVPICFKCYESDALRLWFIQNGFPDV